MATTTTHELSASEAKNVAFASWYRSAFKESGDEDTIRFFDRRGFYSVHGSNAVYIADQFYKTHAALKVHHGLPCSTVSPQMFSTTVRDLLCDKGYRVELWQGSGASWTREKHGSPGNLEAWEELLDAAGMYGSATIVGIKMGPTDRTLGVFMADSSLQTLGMCEFPEDNEWSTLESLLVQVSAKECIFSADLDPIEQEKLRPVLERCCVTPTEMKRGDFASKDVEADITKLANSKYLDKSQFDKKQALSAASCVLKYLGLVADVLNTGQYKMLDFDVAKFMKLDSAAIRALNVTPATQGNDRSCTSLYGVLNKCRTAMGRRRLMQWLKQPLLDMDQLVERQDVVGMFVEDTMLRQSIMEYLKQVPDMDRLAKRFASRKAGLQDCVTLYYFVKSLPELVDCFKCYSGDNGQLLEQKFCQVVQEAVEDCGQLEQLVESSINLDLVSSHIYEVKPTFDPQLGELSEQRQQIDSEIDQEFAHVSKTVSSAIKLEYNSVHGKHFRVTRKEEKLVRGKQGLTSLATNNKGCIFTTKRLSELNDSHTAATQEFQEFQKHLVRKCVDVVASYVPIMEEMRNVLSDLDVLLSFAEASVSAPKPYVKPTLTKAGVGDIVLKQARHPCLELMQDTASFIPNDVSLVRGDSQLQIITGPNMGGKSTYIRTVGMISLMAQIGCFVPCDEATLCLSDCILARVGAGDSQLHGVSTFMQEMLETAFILRTASSKSLIIVDELGRGTSTYDGFGLAWAISEHLALKTRGICLFATHFHELTALADEADGVKNVHVSAHSENNKLTMLYQVLDGPCDQSFGIHVAEMVNFPPHVVQMAKRKAEELENFGCSSAGSSSKRHKSQPPLQPEQADKFLQAFRELPIDKMNETDIIEAVVRLQREHGIEL